MVIDENGKYYSSFSDALRQCGINSGGHLYNKFNKYGRVTVAGKTFTNAEEEQTDTAQVKEPSILTKLRERYSEKEIDQLLKGHGIANDYIQFEEVHLSGKHHRIAVISDTHIGSVYSPEEWHDTVSSFVNNPENKIECLLHCGDLVDGLKVGRDMQIYELSAIGYDAQRQKAIEIMSKYKLPVYMISGNHDMYFKASAGANIVQAVCEALPNLNYIGHDTADIYVGGIKIRLFHGLDSTSYALSYSLQKLIEGMTGDIPSIFIRGHIHKYVNLYDSGKKVYAVSCPSMQKQTSFLAGKRVQVHTGFIVIDFEVNENTVCNFSITYYPFE